VDQVRVNDALPSAPPAAEPASAPGAAKDLTLDELLHSVAYTKLPTQFYGLLQLAIPAAAELWHYGWYRSAGWMVVVSLYGIWALCAKRIDEAEPDERVSPWWRIGRSVTKGLGLSLTGVVAVLTVVRLLSFVFHNLGGAG
jgi:hypothetical protein